MGATVPAILLAAGGSARMGHNKLLLELEGEPLLRRVARRALQAGLAPVIVVVGHEAARARRALAGLGCTAVDNPAWAAGMNGSLSAGVAALPEGARAAVVLLADMPLVDAAMLRALVERFRETGAPVVASRYGGVVAPPILFARALLPRLTGGRGDGRGREVVRGAGAQARFVDWPLSALLDLDEPADLAAARAGRGAEGGA
jgi:molybdenum cofactor cytidylyltransferase